MMDLRHGARLAPRCGSGRAQQMAPRRHSQPHLLCTMGCTLECAPVSLLLYHCRGSGISQSAWVAGTPMSGRGGCHSAS